MDDLKQVNDSGGHEAGDQALCRAAEALVEAAKPHEDAVVGRFGGDEFCILLPSGTAQDARDLALDAVRRLGAVGRERMSCGVAARTDGATRPAELLRAADEAQYQAKRGGSGVDVVVAGEVVADSATAGGADRAFRASDPDAHLARDLLDMLDNMNGASAEERLSRLRARLEREA
jgi:diguanylate cyclase (GGDEF)-like protein